MTYGRLPGQTLVGDWDGFVVKYDHSGNQAWVRQFGTPGQGTPAGVGVDAAGNVYIGGSIGGGPFPGQTPVSYYDIFLVKYGPLGSQLWVRQFGAVVAKVEGVGPPGGVADA